MLKNHRNLLFWDCMRGKNNLNFLTLITQHWSLWNPYYHLVNTLVITSAFADDLVVLTDVSSSSSCGRRLKCEIAKHSSKRQALQLILSAHLLANGFHTLRLSTHTISRFRTTYKNVTLSALRIHCLTAFRRAKNKPITQSLITKLALEFVFMHLDRKLAVPYTSPMNYPPIWWSIPTTFQVHALNNSKPMISHTEHDVNDVRVVSPNRCTNSKRWLTRYVSSFPKLSSYTSNLTGITLCFLLWEIYTSTTYTSATLTINSETGI